MTPAAIIEGALSDGVILSLSPTGSIKANGSSDAVNRWRPVISEHRQGIITQLQTGILPLSAQDEEAIRQWLVKLGTTDAAEFAEVLEQCRQDSKALAYALKRASEIDGEPWMIYHGEQGDHKG